MADRDWLNELNSDAELDNGLSELDELIRSTKEELRRSDELMGDVPPSEPEPELPKQPETPAQPAFEPHIPEEYADLTLEEEAEDDLPVKTPRKRLPAGVRVLIYVVSVLLASVVLALVGWKCADDVLALTKPDTDVTIMVEQTDTVKEIAADLKANGLIEYEWLFEFYCWFSNAKDKIDPGTYDLNMTYDYHALVNGMAGTSNRAVVTVTIPEGYEVDQIFELLSSPEKLREQAEKMDETLPEGAIVCSLDELQRAAANTEFDYSFLRNVPKGEYNRLEGYLFPDTYDFFIGDDPDRVLNKFLKNFERKFTEQMQTDIDALNEWLRAKMEAGGFDETQIEAAKMDLNKVIIVASLIEKETGSAAESATISSVIYNRLCSDLYPCLQIDATIQYVLDERKEILSAADLAIVSPYNTYTNPGLPVGPISNPGLASINAALHPEDTNYYFYALDKGTSHHFSETYFEHNQFLEQQKNENAS